MDIHIILETTDARELQQARRLIDFLQGEFEPRVAPGPDEVVTNALTATSEQALRSAPAAPAKPAKEKTSRKKPTPPADTRQTEIPGTETKQPVPAADFSTPVAAAQSLARSRKDGIASVVTLLRDLGAARVSDLPKEKHAEFMTRAEALAAGIATS